MTYTTNDPDSTIRGKRGMLSRVWPGVLITVGVMLLIWPPLGLIPALIFRSKARKRGLSYKPYIRTVWVTWLCLGAVMYVTRSV